MPTLAEKPRPIANDHHGSETGKPASRCTMQADGAAEHDAEQAAERRQEHGLEQELPAGCRARLAPSAFLTPISRVRSVTEIIMIAITPMPPTISAIDEITTSARKIARVN